MSDKKFKFELVFCGVNLVNKYEKTCFLTNPHPPKRPICPFFQDFSPYIYAKEKVYN